MRLVKFFFCLTLCLFAEGGTSEGCLDAKQRQKLEAHIGNQEKKFQQVLLQEMTAHAENLDAGAVTETARKIYFELRNLRAELARSQSEQCLNKKSE